MKVMHVDPESPLFGSVRAGYSLRAINGQPVSDLLDFQFKASEERIQMTFTDPNGAEHSFRFEALYPGELGLSFEDDRIRRCQCNCVFCFVHQQPKGMRRALYVKDEDYRLSFTHGNFITLSNVTDDDIERIISQRLSPLYVSVHTTDDDLRRRMLGNANLRAILPTVRHLVDNGITVHTQVVVCPQWNDGANLERTIDDLAALHPGVESLAVVPVGVTRYRSRLTQLRRPTPDEARATVGKIEKRQRDMLGRLGTRFVWAADEYYVLAGRKLPSQSSYEAMPQFENGVGMLRDTLTAFNRRRRYLKRLKSKKQVLFLTGQSAAPFLNDRVVSYVRQKLGLKLSTIAVPNRFWGETVTVSGLLTGADLLKAAAEKTTAADLVVLPPNCLNPDELFLDDMSLDQFQAALGLPVMRGSYDLAATIGEAFA
ncbi:MAG: DUF512 domain-containing protein [bacterium]